MLDRRFASATQSRLVSQTGAVLVRRKALPLVRDTAPHAASAVAAELPVTPSPNRRTRFEAPRDQHAGDRDLTRDKERRRQYGGQHLRVRSRRSPVRRASFAEGSTRPLRLLAAPASTESFSALLRRSAKRPDHSNSEPEYLTGSAQALAQGKNL